MLLLEHLLVVDVLEELVGGRQLPVEFYDVSEVALDAGVGGLVGQACREHEYGVLLLEERRYARVVAVWVHHGVRRGRSVRAHWMWVTWVARVTWREAVGRTVHRRVCTVVHQMRVGGHHLRTVGPHWLAGKQAYSFIKYKYK